jgi:hypothetical protein
MGDGEIMSVKHLVALAAVACGTAAGCASLLGDFTQGSGGTDATVSDDGGLDGAPSEDSPVTEVGADAAHLESGALDASMGADTSTCTSGIACTPAVCINGTIECTPSTVCSVVGPSPTGSSCEGGVCNDGGCIACKEGDSCAEAGSCQTMSIVCSSGGPVCTLGSNLPNGTQCDAGAYCNNGQCAPCMNGAPCTPTDSCHQGSTMCSGGNATCTDLGTNASNGTPCGMNEVCNNGSCSPCTSGTSCNPGGNPCQTGTTSCTTGTQTCTSPSDVATGTVCGTNQACNAGTCFTVAPPQPVAPLSTALVTSQKPTLHWNLANGTTGAQVDICANRGCTTVVQTVSFAGSSGQLPSALSRGLYFWQLRGMVGSTVGTTAGPVWEMRVGQRSAPVDTSWGTFVDVNGDGLADLAVGASATGSNAGAAYVYLSTGAGGLSSTAAALSPSGGSFGFSLASAGDVNGDGYGDLIVGAQGANTAYVYLGGPSGIATSPLVTLTGSGDFGWAVASAGDVNGDGYGDVVVASPEFSSNAGAAYIYLGGPSGTSATPASTLSGSAGAFFGNAAAPAGDVNGDGYGDVLLGAPDVSSNTGAAYVYLGSAGGLGSTPITIPAPASGDSFGYAAWGADDVNGDGYADVVVGANYATGAAYVYSGSAAGTATSPATSIASPAGTSGFFGCAVSTAGDVNGDGYSDVIVGAFEAGSSNIGAAYLYLGGSGGLSGTAAVSLTNPMTSGGGFFGFAVAGAGDVNGDGLADVAIGASSNGNGAGNAYVYYGTGTGVSHSPNTTLTGGASAQFGKGIN